jgi:hypothetical protein
MEKREQRAEVLIALLFVLLGGLTCLIALIVLYEKESPDDVIAGALRIASPSLPDVRLSMESLLTLSLGRRAL